MAVEWASGCIDCSMQVKANIPEEKHVFIIGMFLQYVAQFGYFLCGNTAQSSGTLCSTGYDVPVVK